MVAWLLNFSAALLTLVESADSGRYSELSFFCTFCDLDWKELPPSPAISRTRASAAEGPEEAGSAAVALTGASTGSSDLGHDDTSWR